VSVKIFHTADLHIGMKLAKYPEQVRSQLQQARNNVLPKMIQMANDKNCNLFVIAGDLFHNIKGIDKKTIAQTAKALDCFQGECVLVMPGNHDYDNHMIDLWKTFAENAGERGTEQSIISSLLSGSEVTGVQ
jgi:exonuclease SbcD